MVELTGIELGTSRYGTTESIPTVGLLNATYYRGPPFFFPLLAIA